MSGDQNSCDISLEFVDRDPKILAYYKPYITRVVFHPLSQPTGAKWSLLTKKNMLVSAKKSETLRAPQRIVRTATMISQMALGRELEGGTPFFNGLINGVFHLPTFTNLNFCKGSLGRTSLTRPTLCGDTFHLSVQDPPFWCAIFTFRLVHGIQK